MKKLRYYKKSFRTDIYICCNNQVYCILATFILLNKNTFYRLKINET